MGLTLSLMHPGPPRPEPPIIEGQPNPILLCYINNRRHGPAVQIEPFSTSRIRIIAIDVLKGVRLRYDWN